MTLNEKSKEIAEQLKIISNNCFSSGDWLDRCSDVIDLIDELAELYDVPSDIGMDEDDDEDEEVT